MHLILLGPAGSGKGTLARMLVERDGYVALDMGAELRRFASQPFEEARRLKEELARGNMAPTPLVMDVLERRMAEARGSRFVLDGVPRTPDQALEFVKRLRAGRIQIDRLLLLDAPREILKSRLLLRRYCARCGSIYNLAHSGPYPVNGRCLCGGDLQQRQDDHSAGIKRRFKLYDELTRPALEMLEREGVTTVRIDASRSAEETYEAVRLALRPRAPERAALVR